MIKPVCAFGELLDGLSDSRWGCVGPPGRGVWAERAAVVALAGMSAAKRAALLTLTATGKAAGKRRRADRGRQLSRSQGLQRRLRLLAVYTAAPAAAIGSPVNRPTSNGVLTYAAEPKGFPGNRSAVANLHYSRSPAVRLGTLVNGEFRARPAAPVKFRSDLEIPTPPVPTCGHAKSGGQRSTSAQFQTESTPYPLAGQQQHRAALGRAHPRQGRDVIDDSGPLGLGDGREGSRQGVEVLTVSRRIGAPLLAIA